MIQIVLPPDLHHLVRAFECAWNASEEHRTTGEVKVDETPGKYGPGLATLVLLATVELVTKVGVAVVAALIVKFINGELGRRGNALRVEIRETHRLEDGREMIVVKTIE